MTEILKFIGTVVGAGLTAGGVVFVTDYSKKKIKKHTGNIKEIFQIMKTKREVTKWI